MTKLITALLAAIAAGVCHAQTIPQSRLAIYAQRVTGMQLSPKELQTLSPLDESALFNRLYEQNEFSNYRVPYFVSTLSNEGGNPFEEVDDFQMALGIAIRDNLDFRTVFSQAFYIAKQGDIQIVQPESQNYVERSNRTFAEILSGYRLIVNPDTSKPLPVVENTNNNGFNNRPAPGFTVAGGYYRQGLFTTQGFGKRFLSGGTNRRAVKGVFNIFLCSPIESWRDASLDHYYIAKDVTRSPGELTQTFMEKCAACHAPMDALRGAWALLDYNSNMMRVEEKESPVSKYNQNSQVYPDAPFVTMDASWQNLLVTPAHQERFGWPKQQFGEGVASFADMVVNSKAFGRCMTKKVLKTFCDLTVKEAEAASRSPKFSRLADTFAKNGYRMKSLIRETVKSDLCVQR